MTRARFSLTIVLVFIGIIGVFYFSWLPDPMLSRYGLLPGWLAQWTDAQENDTLRTAVPFVGLGLTTGAYLSAAAKGWRWWAGGWLVLSLIVFIAEAGQLMLPHRNFDWDDVAWGAVGSFGGLLLASSLRLIRYTAKKLRRINKTSTKKNSV